MPRHNLRPVRQFPMLERSRGVFGRWLAAETPSPSHKAVHNEQMLQLCDALELLPEAQREAVQLHYLENMKLAGIAARMERSTTAIAGLLKRGLQKLRSEMNRPESLDTNDPS